MLELLLFYLKTSAKDPGCSSAWFEQESGNCRIISAPTSVSNGRSDSSDTRVLEVASVHRVPAWTL